MKEEWRKTKERREQKGKEKRGGEEEEDLPVINIFIRIYFSVSHDGVFFLVNQQNTVNGIRTSGLLHVLAAAFKPSDLNRSARLIEPLSLHATSFRFFRLLIEKPKKKPQQHRADAL